MVSTVFGRRYNVEEEGENRRRESHLVDDEVESVSAAALREDLVQRLLRELLEEVGLVLERARAESSTCRREKKCELRRKNS